MQWDRTSWSYLITHKLEYGKAIYCHPAYLTYMLLLLLSRISHVRLCVTP